MQKLVLLGALAVLSACNANAPPAAPVDSTTSLPDATARTAPPPAAPPPVATPLPAGSASPAFVGKVWRVEQSSAVEPGSTYTFLEGGALVMGAPHGTPATGRWSYVDGELTMTEEGVDYPTDIVSLDAQHFTIRSHNPGGAIEIVMSAVAGAPLPVPGPDS